MSTQLSQRARDVLSRFPAHLDVERTSKQFAHVVEALGDDFDSFASQLAGVRNAHRLDYAPTIADLMLLAGLHGVSNADLSLTTVRAERLRELFNTVRGTVDAGGDAMRAAAADLLDAFAIAGVEPDRLLALAPGTPDGTPPNDQDAARALLDAANTYIGFDAELEGIRRRIRDICTLHANGNGTVRAMLHATLSALDLEVDTQRNEIVRANLIAEGRTEDLNLDIHDEFFHSADHFWHSTYVRNSLPLTVAVTADLPPAEVLMGDTIALAVLSQRSRIGVARLIERAQAAGYTDATFGTRITFDDADAIATLEGFTVQRVPRGTIELTGPITATDLALRIAITAARVRGDLTALAGFTLAADALLTPQQAAIVARKFGYRVMLRPQERLEALGLEENPLHRESRPPIPVAHGQTFTVRRRGFGRQLLRVQIEGVEDLTMGPMVVNREEGRGVGFFGAVPAGSKLLITEEGRVYLDGADHTTFAYSWTGGCFADAVAHTRDFVFDGPHAPAGRVARFATVTPAGALDREAIFPHAAESLVMPGINVGETRLAFFVQQAHTGFRVPPASTFDDLLPTPRNTIAFANQSVFAGGDDPLNPVGPHPLDPVAAQLTLSWLEHEGYAVRVIIPSRLRYLSGTDVSVEERLVQALERIRPAGIEVRVDFADDRWTLGQGSVTDEELMNDNPNDLLRGGTRLWTEEDL